MPTKFLPKGEGEFFYFIFIANFILLSNENSNSAGREKGTGVLTFPLRAQSSEKPP